MRSVCKPSRMMAAALCWLVIAAAPGSLSAVSMPGSVQLTDAQALIDRGAYQEAITTLWDYTQNNPSDPDAYNLLGFSYRKSGQFDRAKKAYERALRLDPDHKGAHEYLGELYVETNQLAKAEEMLNGLRRRGLRGIPDAGASDRQGQGLMSHG